MDAGTEERRLQLEFWELLVLCFEGAHVWEFPQREGAANLGKAHDGDQLSWVRATLTALVVSGCVELGRFWLVEGPRMEDEREELDSAEALRWIRGKDAWVPGRMDDGSMIDAHLTAAGQSLLRAVANSLPGDYEFFGSK